MFEYSVVVVSFAEEIDSCLNEFAREGWTLCGIYPYTVGSSLGFVIVMHRIAEGVEDTEPEQAAMPMKT